MTSSDLTADNKNSLQQPNILLNSANSLAAANGGMFVQLVDNSPDLNLESAELENLKSEISSLLDYNNTLADTSTDFELDFDAADFDMNEENLFDPATMSLLESKLDAALTSDQKNSESGNPAEQIDFLEIALNNYNFDNIGNLPDQSSKQENMSSIALTPPEQSSREYSEQFHVKSEPIQHSHQQQQQNQQIFDLNNSQSQNPFLVSLLSNNNKASTKINSPNANSCKKSSLITTVKKSEPIQHQHNSASILCMTPADSPAEISNHFDQTPDQRHVFVAKKSTSRLMSVDVTALKLVPIQGEKKLMNVRKPAAKVSSTDASSHSSTASRKSTVNIMPVAFTVHPQSPQQPKNKINFSIISQSMTHSQSVLSSINNTTLAKLITHLNKASNKAESPQKLVAKMDQQQATKRMANYADELDLENEFFTLVRSPNNNKQIRKKEYIKGEDISVIKPVRIVVAKPTNQQHTILVNKSNVVNSKSACSRSNHISHSTNLGEYIDTFNMFNDSANLNDYLATLLQ